MVIFWCCLVFGFKVDKFVFEKKMFVNKNGIVFKNYMDFWF